MDLHEENESLRARLRKFEATVDEMYKRHQQMLELLARQKELIRRIDPQPELSKCDQEISDLLARVPSRPPLPQLTSAGEAMSGRDEQVEDRFEKRMRPAWRQLLDLMRGLSERHAKIADQFEDFASGGTAPVRVPTPPRLPQLTLGAAVPLPPIDESVDACGTIPPNKR
jgi:hypothetical protein